MASKSVTLINPFEVPAGREEECLALWKEAAAVLKKQPGFIHTRLHQNIAPTVRPSQDARKRLSS